MRGKEMERDKNRNSISGIAALLLILVFLITPIFSFAGDRTKDSMREEQRVAGKWLRPDGGYILELRDVKKEGTLTAAYFNPRPINVASASWRREMGKIVVFVELRDVNYPGSTYMLFYVPDKDLLSGYYYQAALDQMFEVMFIRDR